MENQDKASSINEDQGDNTEASSLTNNSEQLIPTDLDGAVLQLKEKIKENKKIENKNKKLEAKFIEQFKEQKALKKDWTALTSIIKIIFPESEEKPIGRYDMDELKEMWAYRESTFTSKIQEMMEETAKQKEKMEKDLVELTEERIHKISHECKEKVDNISKELDSYKKNNKNLADQLADFDKKLDMKNDEVSKLTKEKLKLEHQINQIKMKTITDELQDKKVVEEQKNVIETNEYLAMRQQVDSLMLKRDELRELLKAAKTNIEKLKETVKEKNEEIAKLKEEKISLSEKSELREPSLKNKQSIESCSSDGTKQEEILNDQRGCHHLAGDDEYVHREYLKNVFIRYMKSIVKGDETQTEILISILLTILKFNSKEREIVQERKKGWFGLY